jgi:hypothetical protein
MKKITLAHKLIAFAASVMTLSWFFAGWRAVNESTALSGWLLLIGATLATALLLGLQGYWIYFEEKQKGTLRRHIGLFEKIHALLNKDTNGNGPKKSACGAEEAQKA